MIPELDRESVYLGIAAGVSLILLSFALWIFIRNRFLSEIGAE